MTLVMIKYLGKSRSNEYQPCSSLFRGTCSSAENAEVVHGQRKVENPSPKA